MAASDRGIWAVDIGNSALKAMHLYHDGEDITVLNFDYVEHSAILSASDLTESQRNEAIADTLSTFISRNDIDKKDEIAISVAGQNSFSRFVPLPPVEPKRIPEIVQFEAVQQIPFDINEVEWDWQLMDNPDSPDKTVGLFAIKNEVLGEALNFFNAEGLRVTLVQISPMAIHNYLLYDRDDVGPESSKATVILDMGAENTTLIVSTQTSVWQRTIRIGGNSFTEAISETFKIRFSKAEKLKRTAAMSKYVRQIFSAMKPVFTDYSSEIQRSLGFYTSNMNGKGFSRIIALGGGMKLKGLAKYLQQSIGITLVKPDSFESLQLDESVSPAKFHEHVSDFGIVYGLGVQALDEAKIKTNLLPRRIARSMALARKTRMFSVAAGILLVVSFICLGNSILNKGKYASAGSDRTYVEDVVRQAQGIESDVQEFEGKIDPLNKIIEEEVALFDYRETIPKLNQTIIECLPNAKNNPDEARLYEAYRSGDIATVKSIPRKDRKAMFITSVDIEYAKDISKAKFGKARRGGVRTSRQSRGGGGDMMMDEMMMDEMMMMGPGGGGTGVSGGRRPGGAMPRSGADSGEAAKEVDGGPGFLVIIEGYSPYGEIEKLMDPLSISSDKSDWGMITRFEKLDSVFEETEFELYGKGDINHFKQEIELVDLNSGLTPAGVGYFRQLERVPAEHLAGNEAGMAAYGAYAANQTGRIIVEDVLVDPMTNEEMSKTYDILTVEDVDADPGKTGKDIGVIKINNKGEQVFIERDHWFRIQAKFKWKKYPAAPTEDAEAATDGVAEDEFGF